MDLRPSNLGVTSEKDKREIFRAAADAQKIVNMVLAFHPVFAELLEPESKVGSSETGSSQPEISRQASECRIIPLTHR